MKRNELLRKLAERITSLHLDHPIRVGIDGVDASGKTWLANELADFLGDNVISASIDGFHNPKEIRYQKGRESAEGYYRDSFNHEAIIQNLLEPLGPTGDSRYKTKIFDYKINKEVDSPELEASKDAILIMDGVFLFRPESVDYWDLKIFIDVPFETTVDRAVKRDIAFDDSWDKEELTRLYEIRYVKGQKLYFKEANPKETADIVIDNTDFDNPVII